MGSGRMRGKSGEDAGREWLGRGVELGLARCARRGGSRRAGTHVETTMGAANLELEARSAHGNAGVRSEVSPVLAGAARAKADKVVAAAWSAGLDEDLSGSTRWNGLTWSASRMQRSPMAPL